MSEAGKLCLRPVQGRGAEHSRDGFYLKADEDKGLWSSGTVSCTADPGGMPIEATVAHVLVSKYADYLPLCRQAQIYSRQGVDLDRSKRMARDMS